MQREFIRCVCTVNTRGKGAFKKDIYERGAKKDRKCRGLVAEARNTKAGTPLL